MKKLLVLLLLCSCASYTDNPLQREDEKKEVAPRYERGAKVLKINPKVHKKAYNSLKPRG